MRWMRELLTQNLAYKSVALLISLILWVTILGRRDFVITKEIEVEVSVAPQMQIIHVSSDRVRLKVSGSRNNLRRFIENGASQLVVIDATNKEPGQHVLAVPTYRLDLPFGVRLLSVKPDSIQVQIASKR